MQVGACPLLHDHVTRTQMSWMLSEQYSIPPLVRRRMCGVVKPAGEFWKKSGNSSGLESRCKACANEVSPSTASLSCDLTLIGSVQGGPNSLGGVNDALSGWHAGPKKMRSQQWISRPAGGCALLCSVSDPGSPSFDAI